MTIPKDLNPDLFQKMVDKNNRQVSLAYILKSVEFQKHLTEKKRATAITTGAKSYDGELEFSEGHLYFQQSGGRQISRDQQNLMVMFEKNNKHLYFQSVTGQVCARKIELVPVSPRFYRRFKINGTAVVSSLSLHEVEGVISGKRVLNHFRSYLSQSDKTHFLALDRFLSDVKGKVEQRYTPSECALGGILDVSQVGCSLSLEADRFSELCDAKVVFVQFSLMISGKMSAVSCFCSVKESWQQDEHILLRCEFLKPLSPLIGEVVDGAQNYTLVFDRVLEVELNGISYGKLERLVVKLPCGLHMLKTREFGGPFTEQSIAVTAMTPEVIKMNCTQILKKAS